MSLKASYISTLSPICSVFSLDEFAQLSENEKQFCYEFSKASYEGQKICYFQKSYEAPAIFTILQLVLSGQTTEILKQQALDRGVREEEVKQFFFYAAGVFNNCGNFQSFGGTKFIPEISRESFRTIVRASKNYHQYSTLINDLLQDVLPFIYGYQGILSRIGFPSLGSTGYYSGNLSQEEIDMIDEFLKIVNIDTLNTRLIKIADKHYGVLIASVNKLSKQHQYQGNQISIQYGDYSPILRRVSSHLQSSIQFASNKLQKQMLQLYVNHFNNGDIEVHKESQRVWVKDMSPKIETNIGFIETYLDPKQVRAEFEGFVTIVDEKKSKKTNQFVSKVPEFLKLMPWPADFEKNEFLKPDFACLNVLSFGSVEAPEGINIPNYDDIRQEHGFKNLYLGNCISVSSYLLYLNKDDQTLILKHFSAAMFHKIVFHELLGHGCGKLFYEGNFDSQNIINPITNEKGTNKFYQTGETWGSVFKSMSNPYEECRADSVALYFSTFRYSYEVLQPEQVENWKEIAVVNYLKFVYTAIKGLQFFNADEKIWGQAHINGSWVILQVLLEAENNFISIEKSVHPDDSTKDWIKVKVDHSQVFTTGQEAMKKFLLKMQVYKSTADIEQATLMFEKYSEVNEKFLEIRKIVIDNIKPKRIKVQGNVLKDFAGTISYKTYPTSVEGIIQSFVDRFPYFDTDVIDLWDENRKLNKPQI